MYSIVYQSLALPVFLENDIPTMLYHAREMNRKHAITGCLLYHNRKFLQLIEGEEITVKQLYNNILLDRRHHQIITLSIEEHPYRIFSNWSMVFDNLSEDSKKVEDKRTLFDLMFHQSQQSPNPTASKMKMWHHVHHVLDDEGMLEET
jgi:hypothetical protein